MKPRAEPLRDLLAVYAITPDGFDPALHASQLRDAFNAGLRCLQLRDKSAPPETLLRLAHSWRRLTADHGALLIINDHADLAHSVAADGVHLGPDDELPQSVRARFPNLIVGASASSAERACRLAQQSVHYLGVGAIFDAQATKPNASHHRGTQLLRELRALPQLHNLPLVAIGGIDLSNAANCYAAGADGVAAVRAILGAPHPASAVTKLLQLRQTSGGRSSSVL